MLRLARKAPAQKAHSENPMNSLHYIGFDVHKKAISFCIKTAAGEIVEEGSLLSPYFLLGEKASIVKVKALNESLEARFVAKLVQEWIHAEPCHPATSQPMSLVQTFESTL